LRLNIHREGLSYDEAAFKIAWLIREGLARKVTGVALKDESGDGKSQRIAGNSARVTNPRLAAGKGHSPQILQGLPSCDIGRRPANLLRNFPYVFKG